MYVYRTFILMYSTVCTVRTVLCHGLRTVAVQAVTDDHQTVKCLAQVRATFKRLPLKMN